ncbi:MAG: 3-dehydroquinate synthase [Candidatus Binatia bacterium]
MSASVPDEVTVELGARSYQVVVGSDLLGSLGSRVAALGFRGRCGLVTSARVAALYRDPAVRSLKMAGLDPVVIEIPDGEEHKNLAWLAVIYDRLIDAGLDRHSVVVALGGGVIGDLAGFAAATLLRGIAVVQVPTTLLAMVDAAIGGKTAVNHARGKNLIGAFHQPRLVLADVGLLRTLPRREFRAGLAEVVKYGVIGDAALFAELEERLDAVLAHDEALLVRVVVTSVRHKAAVVAADEREETGGRAVLNFGHTVGHAIEVLTEYRQLLHGEAVAIGMVAAARISQGIGCCETRTRERLQALLERAGLPTEIPSDLRPQALALAMQADKKAAAGRIRFVAVEAIGRTRLVELTASEIVSHL